MPRETFITLETTQKTAQRPSFDVGEPGIELYEFSTPFGYFVRRLQNTSKAFRSRPQNEKSPGKPGLSSFCRGAGNRTRTTRSQTEYTTTMLHPD